MWDAVDLKKQDPPPGCGVLGSYSFFPRYSQQYMDTCFNASMGQAARQRLLLFAFLSLFSVKATVKQNDFYFATGYYVFLSSASKSGDGPLDSETARHAIGALIYCFRLFLCKILYK